MKLFPYLDDVCVRGVSDGDEVQVLGLFKVKIRSFVLTWKKCDLYLSCSDVSARDDLQVEGEAWISKVRTKMNGNLDFKLLEKMEIWLLKVYFPY